MQVTPAYAGTGVGGPLAWARDGLEVGRDAGPEPCLHEQAGEESCKRSQADQPAAVILVGVLFHAFTYS